MKMAPTKTTVASDPATTIEDRLHDIAEILVKQQTINIKLNSEITAVLQELSAAKEAIAHRDSQLTALITGQQKLEEMIEALATAAEVATVRSAVAEKDEQISSLIDAQVQTDATMISFATAAELKAAQAAIAERDGQIRALVEGQVKTDALIRAWCGSLPPADSEASAEPLPAPEPPSPQFVLDKANLLAKPAARSAIIPDRDSAVLQPDPAPEPVQAELNFFFKPSTAAALDSTGESPIIESKATREGSFSGARKRERPAEASPKLPWAERVCRFLGM